MFSRFVESLYPVFLAGLLIPVAASGQTVGAPSLGYLCDATSGGVRPVIGVPGAASQGPVLTANLAYSKCFISPSNTFALLEREDGSGVAQLNLSNAAEPKLLEGVKSGATLLAFSHSGHAAVFYFGPGADAYLVTGLPQLPVISKLDVSAIPSRITSLSVDDSGSLLLAGTVEATNSSLFLINPGSGSVRLLSSTLMPSAIAFVGNTDDALVADGLTGRLILLKQVSTSASQSQVGKIDISGTKILRISRDGKTALLGNPALGTITAIDLAGETSLTVPCVCQLVEFQQMAGNIVFLVGNSASQVPVVFDADSLSPRLVSIPNSISPQRNLSERQ